MCNSPSTSPSLQERRVQGSGGGKEVSKATTYQEVLSIYPEQQETRGEVKEKAFSLHSSKATWHSNHTLLFFCKLSFTLILLSYF